MLRNVNHIIRTTKNGINVMEWNRNKQYDDNDNNVVRMKDKRRKEKTTIAK